MAVRGKIIKSIAGFYEVHTSDPAAGSVTYRCRAKGVFRALKQKPLVGDDVEIEITDPVSVPPEGNVVKLLPRKNDLIRPNVANVDQALLLFAITYPVPSYNMVDRFLITMGRKDLPAILCFNKQDLARPDEIRELRETYEACGCKVLFLSALDEIGIRSVGRILEGKTTVVTGPSGAGKSSLINRLCPDARLETGELSKKIGRGKNTTRHVELFFAGKDTFLVDTPGFTSLSLFDLKAEQIRNFYPEFEPYAPECRFHGCNHLTEPGCAVRQAVQEGRISRIRYQNYTEIFAQQKAVRPDYGKRDPR